MPRYIKSIVSLVFALVIMLSAVPMEADAAFNPDLDIHCDALYMVNLETGVVVYEKNADAQKYPASLTKIMTTLLALEHYPDPSAVTVSISPDAMNDAYIISEVGTSPAKLKAGEQMTLKDLLYCVMICSDNFAAQAVAYQVSADFGDGTSDWFINKMNERAAELGCTGTHFANSHGLFNENHYVTAADMYLIAAQAMKIPFFADMVDEPVYYRAATNLTEKPTELWSTNYMMLSARPSYYNKLVKGIKTGYIKAAGHCVVSYAVNGGYSYIIVALDDGATVSSSTNYAFKDSNTLFGWAFEDLILREIVSYDVPIAEVPLELAWDKDALLLLPAESFRTLLPRNVSADSVYITVDLPESVRAPIEQGEVIGSADFTYGGIYIGSVELVAGDTVERSGLLLVIDSVRSFFASPVFIVIFLIFVILIAIYVGYTLLERNKNIRSSQVMRTGSDAAKSKPRKSKKVIRRH